jgi:hypothetical protein
MMDALRLPLLSAAQSELLVLSLRCILSAAAVGRGRRHVVQRVHCVRSLRPYLRWRFLDTLVQHLTKDFKMVEVRTGSCTHHLHRDSHICAGTALFVPHLGPPWHSNFGIRWHTVERHGQSRGRCYIGWRAL